MGFRIRSGLKVCRKKKNRVARIVAKKTAKISTPRGSTGSDHGKGFVLAGLPYLEERGDSTSPVGRK